MPQTSRPKAVSHDADRDSAKVTMQTRVAVRDKIPHRFQIIPLREVMKQPSDQTPGTRVARSFQQSSSRSFRFSPHIDDPGTDKRARSMGRTSAGLALRSKDINLEISTPAHKKIASLEDQERAEESVLPKNSAPSHGYSPSSNQYSFRLKPWRSFTQMKAKDADLHVQRPSSDTDSASPPKHQSGDHSCESSHSSNQQFSDFSKTPDYSDPQFNLTLPKLSDYDSKKRHAIYSDTGIVPLQRAGPFSDSGQQSLPLPLSDPLKSPDPSSTPSSTSRMLPTVLPLRLVRNSTIRPKLGSRDVDRVLHPGIILQLMQDLDKAIASWS